VIGVNLRSVVENHEVVVGHEVTVGDSSIGDCGSKENERRRQCREHEAYHECTV
jgi:hypothetical protein